MQNKLFNNCDQFKQCLQMIDENFDSTRNSQLEIDKNNF